MSTTDLPPRRAMYFLNPTPPPVLTQAALDALDKDPVGIALVAGIITRKANA